MAENASNVDVLDSLRQVPLFSRVGEADLENIAALLIERRYPKNSIIVEEGLTGDYMYIIRTGRVKVTKAMAGRRDESRMANCMVSSFQPWAVHSLRMRSSSSSQTLLVSTTL